MSQHIHEQNPGQGSILSLTIRDRATLHAAFMPFLRNGGIFIPTSRSCAIGSQAFLLLTLPESDERLGIAGQVAWITPPHAQGNRAPGIGIQFLDTTGTTRRKIEELLEDYLNHDALTHTM